MSPDTFLAKDTPKHTTHFRLKLLVYALSLGVFAGALLPTSVKAEGLEELSSNLQYTMEQDDAFINSMTQPATGTIGSINNRMVEDVIGSHTNPNGDLFGQINQAIQTFLSPFQQQLQQYLQVFNISFETILDDLLGDLLKRQPWDEQWEAGQPGSGDGSGATGSTGDRDFDIPEVITGPLGIPDFIRNHEALFERVVGGAREGTPAAEVQRVDRFNLNPVPLAQSIQFMEDRVQNNGMAATILSSEGQAAMKQEMEAATMTLQQIQTKAQEAQSMDVTQDVMKNLTTLQASQSTLIGGSYAQLMALRAQEATNSVVTSNISESLDEANRARHAETLATADHILRTAAGFYLPGLVK